MAINHLQLQQGRRGIGLVRICMVRVLFLGMFHLVGKRTFLDSMQSWDTDLPQLMW